MDYCFLANPKLRNWLKTADMQDQTDIFVPYERISRADIIAFATNISVFATLTAGRLLKSSALKRL